MLWALAVLLGLVVALLAVLLLAPLRLRAQASSTPPRLLVELRLFGGLARVALVDSARPRKPKAAQPSAKPKSKRGWRPSRPFLKALPREVMAILRAVRLERLQGELRLGLEDPAMTGELYGRLGAVLVALPLHDRFRLIPLFDREAIEGEGELALSLVPARLLPVGARLLWAARVRAPQ
ncbi:MAG: DUF2953 domain-containing protein [Pararhodobacter sp.]